MTQIDVLALIVGGSVLAVTFVIMAVEVMGGNKC